MGKWLKMIGGGWLIALVVTILHMQTPVRANECTGSHGAGSSILCAGDNLTGSGAYIQSPNGSYRLYISNGDLQVKLNNNFVFVLAYCGGGIVQAKVESDGAGGVAFIAYTSGGACWFGPDVGLGSTSTAYIKMDNDGCVREYGSNDSPGDAVCS